VKHLTIILTIIFVTTLTSCRQNKSIDDKQIIDFTEVEYIEIRNQSRQADTIQRICKRLTIEQSKDFIERWNNAKANGPCKYIVLFWVDIKLKDGTSRTFRINGKNIIEKNDYCFEMGDNKLIENLWKELNANHIQNIKNIFDDYVEYQESTDEQDDKNLMTKSLESLNKLIDPNELEILINVWLYYDPTDFPSRNLAYKILQNSRPESIKAVKTRISNKKDWEKDGSAPYSELHDLLKQLEK
jgi:hypothetical protein